MRARGFTLIEVLVALTIVAITLAAGVRAAGALTSSSQRLADVTAAQWCADNQLTSIRLAHQFPSVGDAEYGCEQLGHTYPGHVVVRPTPNPNFRRIDAQIMDESGHVLLTLSTVLPRY